MGQHIILIGFMGAGKTTVGRRLAALLGRELLDTDQQIERQAGMTINRIFETEGEASFRRRETEALRRLADRKAPAVISAGGGLPLREENREILKTLGLTVYLRVRPETVLQRLEGDHTRPLLAGEHPEETVRRLLEERGGIYAMAASLTADTDGKSPEAIAEEIRGAMENGKGGETVEAFGD